MICMTLVSAASADATDSRSPALAVGSAEGANVQASQQSPVTDADPIRVPQLDPRPVASSLTLLLGCMIVLVGSRRRHGIPA
jgi:hypothetical protein